MIKIGWIIIFAILSFLFYVVYFRDYALKRNHSHKCLRCGNCCKLLVKLNGDEIKKIKGLGYSGFLSPNNYIKKVNGYCFFLKFNNGATSCLIQEVKPRICNNFPNSKGILGKRFDPRCKVFYGKFW